MLWKRANTLHDHQVAPPFIFDSHVPQTNFIHCCHDRVWCVHVWLLVVFCFLWSTWQALFCSVLWYDASCEIWLNAHKYGCKNQLSCFVYAKKDGLWQIVNRKLCLITNWTNGDWRCVSVHTSQLWSLKTSILSPQSTRTSLTIPDALGIPGQVHWCSRNCNNHEKSWKNNEKNNNMQPCRVSARGQNHF